MDKSEAVSKVQPFFITIRLETDSYKIFFCRQPIFFSTQEILDGFFCFFWGFSYPCYANFAI